jgi:N,N'-diacetyllegionaminate synthase
MYKLKFIAEIANTHQGNIEKAIDLALKADEAGAYAVKFQMYFPEELTTKSHPSFNQFKRQSFSLKDWKYLFSKLKNLKAKIYLDIFGTKALNFSKNFKIEGYKIHLSDIANYPLIKKLSKVKQKIFIGSGGANIIELKKILEILKNNRVIILHGFQAYPTKIKDCNFNRIKYFKNNLGNRVKYGISEHIDGGSETSIYLPLICIPLGIEYIEKHITLDRTKKEVDYESSLDPINFKKCIDFSKKVIESLGEIDIKFSKDELVYRNSVKKKWIAKESINKGNKISKNQITFLREDSDSPGLEYNDIINKIAFKSIQKNSLITKNCFENKVMAIIIARCNSKRLKNKALALINNEPSIVHLFKRIIISLEKKYVNKIVLCTTTNSDDDKLYELANKFKIETFRGSEKNVIERINLPINKYPEYNTVIRLTADDLLIDPFYLKKTIIFHFKNNLNYSSCNELPDGTSVEVFDASVLRFLNKTIEYKNKSEYLTTFILDNKEIFNIGNLKIKSSDKSNLRLSLDTIKDHHLLNELLFELEKAGKKYNYKIIDILKIFKKNKNLKKINKNVVQKQIDSKYTKLTVE